MRRIEKKFSLLKKNGEKGLITFITAGDPDMRTTESLTLKMEETGSDIIELGVPFSDPLADGPVIQKAQLRSLNNGTSLNKIIKLVDRLRKKTQIPIVLMSSYNPIFCYREGRFASDAASVGVDGIIVPDLPPEEGKKLREASWKNGLDMIFLAAPTSSLERIKYICNISRGFIYYVSLTGVTGTRERLPDNIKGKLAEIKQYSKIPAAIGFGISKPEHITALGEASDAVIVGSAIVKVIEDNINNKRDMINEVGMLTSRLKQGCRNVKPGSL